MAEPTSMPLVVGGRYRLVRLLARGGMAEVHEAVDERLDRRVALKWLLPACTEAARFRREVELLLRLRHPHLVPLLDAGVADGRPYAVLPLYERTLTDRLAAGPLDAAEVRRIGAAIASALEHLHRRNVVHRDVKPSNVLLGPDGAPCLTDLGIARCDDTALTATGLTIGTAAYLAPEQAVGEPVGPPADVYALGLVLLECCTGTRAFVGSGAELVAARVTRDPVVPTAVDPSMRSLIQAMTTRRPGERPGAAAVAAALGSDGPVSTEVLPAVASVPSRRVRRGVVVGAAAAMVLAVAAFAWVPSGRPGRGATVEPTTTTTAPIPTTTTAPPPPPTTVVTVATPEPRPGPQGNARGHDKPCRGNGRSC